ncbi:MAG: type II toxin-antitoxin system PrlF family antitoxin [Hyphomonadaceae bacterium]|nr:type II toxin-antitoxin system PrlF family antitoxin [Hyphomonadaceae bacterium]
MGHSLTVKGQVTLPKRVREHLHLKPGDKVAFDIQPSGDVVIRAQRKSVEALLKSWEGLAGIWEGPPADELMMDTRGPPDETGE